MAIWHQYSLFAELTKFAIFLQFALVYSNTCLECKLMRFETNL